jgi:hypothetical protein
MNFLRNIFTKKDEPIISYFDFWIWFQENEKVFFDVVKNRKDINKMFFDKLSNKLNKIKEGYFYLTGMYDDNTAELVLTADGNPKNIAFVEELIIAAPKINNWKFTALKSAAINIEDLNIEMAGYKFNSNNIYFYSNNNPNYPDEINISIVHDDLTENNKTQITNGIFIFLDNYLGELDFLTNIDIVSFVNKSDSSNELIPITKLKDFLIWRQKEFIEKYKGIRYKTENDNYSMLEAELESGNMLFAVINMDLLNWDSKASHPWISVMTIKYDGGNNNGMPNDHDYKLLNTIEEEMMEDLKDYNGYLNIGRQTANSEREIYFACKDFRKPSKILYLIQQKYKNKFEIEYDIYKDKYWQSFDRFNSN